MLPYLSHRAVMPLLHSEPQEGSLGLVSFIVDLLFLCFIPCLQRQETNGSPIRYFNLLSATSNKYPSLRHEASFKKSTSSRPI